MVEPVVRAALLEDLGRAGDITTDAIIGACHPERNAVIPSEVEGQRKSISAEIVARKPGRVAGLGVAELAFTLLDPGFQFERLRPDGSDVEARETVARLNGSARTLLSAERTALNFLCRLSGVATATRALVRAVEGTGAAIACTRKTTPGLRSLEKYAVRVGGGRNHRFGLDDAVLIKDNHIVAAGSVAEAIERVRRAVGHLVKIEIEVDTLDQLREVLSIGGVDAVLLDNMTEAQLREAVKLAGERVVLEASGSVNLESVISSGSITHSAPALDFGLDFLS